MQLRMKIQSATVLLVITLFHTVVFESSETISSEEKDCQHVWKIKGANHKLISWSRKNAYSDSVGVTICLNPNTVSLGEMKDCWAYAHIPKEIIPNTDSRFQDSMVIKFCKTNLPKLMGDVYDDPMGSLINDTAFSQPSDSVNRTVHLQNPSTLRQDNVPECEFYNDTMEEFDGSGCSAEWNQNSYEIACVCRPFSFYVILLVSPRITEIDRKAMTCITLVGCSLSLISLFLTLILFNRYRKMVPDVSLRVHLNLIVALILLNLHFMPSQLVADLSASGPCVYLAVLLHYSLLATFTWMAIEGFHLYLLLVRVFNIYIQRYLLKLCLVGWGVPVVIVALVGIINKDAYQRVSLPAMNNGTALYMCYLTDGIVKLVTTVGFFSLVFAFNLGILVVVIRRVHMLRGGKAPAEKGRGWKNIFSVLGITSLLGLTWSLPFFCIKDTTCSLTVLYISCILNSLQGFFICVWLYMSKRRAKETSATPGETQHLRNQGSPAGTVSGLMEC